MLFADRGYDHDKYRRLLWQRGIRPVIAERGQPHGSGLGIFRWVVERTISWLHGFHRLRIRWERRDDIHEAFLGLATCLITHRHVQRLCWDLLVTPGRTGRSGYGCYRSNSRCSMSVKRTSSRLPARRPPSWKYTSLSPSATISWSCWSGAPVSWASKRRAA